MLVTVVIVIFRLFYILLIAHIILSFVPFSTLGYDHPIRRTINDIMEPILMPVRRILPPMGGLDFSPMLVLILASVLQNVLISVLA